MLGTTFSTNFPTISAARPLIRVNSTGDRDIFITKINLNTPQTISAGPAVVPNPSIVGATVVFSATATDPENTPLTYSWNFGDGSSDSSSNYVTHAYATVGSFPSTLTVSDGLTNTIVPFTVTVLPAMPTVVTPRITPDSGAFTNAVKVTLSCTTAGATIRYTTNGAEPTGSSTIYKKTGITITNSVTLKA